MRSKDPAFAAFSDLIIRSVAPLTPSELTLNDIADACELRVLAKGDHLLRVGDIDNIVGWRIFLAPFPATGVQADG